MWLLILGCANNKTSDSNSLSIKQVNVHSFELKVTCTAGILYLCVNVFPFVGGFSTLFPLPMHCYSYYSSMDPDGR
jgi:hypothetical protein